MCNKNIIKLKSYIKLHTLIVEDFSTPISPRNRSARQKPNIEIRDFTDVMTKTDLTDTYRTFHPNTK